MFFFFSFFLFFQSSVGCFLNVVLHVCKCSVLCKFCVLVLRYCILRVMCMLDVAMYVLCAFIYSMSMCNVLDQHVSMINYDICLIVKGLKLKCFFLSLLIEKLAS